MPELLLEKPNTSKIDQKVIEPVKESPRVLLLRANGRGLADLWASQGKDDASVRRMFPSLKD